MPRSCVIVYVHFVWSTWDRMPLITADVEAGVHAAIAAKCRELQCRPIAIGGIEDHVHALVRLHSTVSIAGLAHDMKGSSSHLGSQLLAPERFFKWQGTYGAFSVSEPDVPRARNYIANQRARHSRGDTIAAWERCAEYSDDPDPW